MKNGKQRETTAMPILYLALLCACQGIEENVQNNHQLQGSVNLGEQEGDVNQGETLLALGPVTASAGYKASSGKYLSKNAVKTGAVGTQCNWPSAGSVAIAAGRNKYWQTDLGKTSIVNKVKIRGFNISGRLRTGFCNNVQISMCNDSNGKDCTKCGAPVTVGATGSVTAQCSGAKGRYVRLFNANTGKNWHFCRVEVFGLPVPPPWNLEFQFVCKRWGRFCKTGRRRRGGWPSSQDGARRRFCFERKSNTGVIIWKKEPRMFDPKNSISGFSSKFYGVKTGFSDLSPGWSSGQKTMCPRPRHFKAPDGAALNARGITRGCKTLSQMRSECLQNKEKCRNRHQKLEWRAAQEDTHYFSSPLWMVQGDCDNVSHCEAGINFALDRGECADSDKGWNVTGTSAAKQCGYVQHKRSMVCGWSLSPTAAH